MISKLRVKNVQSRPAPLRATKMEDSNHNALNQSIKPEKVYPSQIPMHTQIGQMNCVNTT